MTLHLLVGFHSTVDSMEPLKWAIRIGNEHGARLTVVHATGLPITVHNGPSAAIANTLGNPTWATVHSIVAGLRAPESTTTIVEHGNAIDVLAKHARDTTAVILGRRRFRLLPVNTEKRLRREIDVPVVRVGDSEPARMDTLLHAVHPLFEMSDSKALN